MMTAQFTSIDLPSWFVLMIPGVPWLLLALWTFLVNALVLFLWLRVVKGKEWLGIWKSVFPVCWGINLAVDLGLCLLMNGIYFLSAALLQNDPGLHELRMQAISFFLGPGFGLIGAIIGAVLTGVLDARFAFRKVPFPDREKKQGVFLLALCCAPWFLAFPFSVLSTIL